MNGTIKNLTVGNMETAARIIRSKTGADMFRLVPPMSYSRDYNMRIGNDKDLLIKIISQCLPYIGYPRSLNALRCLNEAAK